MDIPKPMPLSETDIHLRPRGAAEFCRKDFSNVEKTGRGTIIWDPKVEGVLAFQFEQSEDGEHRGERHLDSDEVLCVQSGAFRLVLELDGGTKEVAVKAGEVVIVPQSVWHRLLIDEPVKALGFGGGRTEIRMGAAGRA